MSISTLYIKNMVCPRCIEAVQHVLSQQSILINYIELGKVIVDADMSEDKLSELENLLKQRGFELIKNKNLQIVEAIKNDVIDVLHHNQSESEHVNMSHHISDKLGYDYSYLSTIFSAEMGITIEKFIITQKIEKVKELLGYNELSLKEISYHLGYSSISHLSNQFKKITGLTTSKYKKQVGNKRKSLDCF
jgi:AraC-like DNA-binding protein